MNEVIRTILERRTIRKYESKQISEADLKQIIEAGLYAPTAGGRQGVEMLVCQDTQINKTLGKINRLLFGPANSDGIKFVSETQRSIADDNNIKNGFYDAPTVITLFAPKDWIYGVNDCTSVAITMELAAWSLGIGSCYVSRAEDTFNTDLGRELMQKSGISEDYIARVCLCFGYPEGEIGKAKPRKKGRVKFV